jgi:hypothetical protein
MDRDGARFTLQLRRKNLPEVAQLLCEYDADVNVRSSKDGWTS